MNLYADTLFQFPHDNGCDTVLHNLHRYTIRALGSSSTQLNDKHQTAVTLTCDLPRSASITWRSFITVTFLIQEHSHFSFKHHGQLWNGTVMILSERLTIFKQRIEFRLITAQVVFEDIELLWWCTCTKVEHWTYILFKYIIVVY